MLPLIRLIVKLQQPAGGVVPVGGRGPVGVGQARPAGAGIEAVRGQGRAGGATQLRPAVELIVSLISGNRVP